MSISSIASAAKSFISAPFSFTKNASSLPIPAAMRHFSAQKEVVSPARSFNFNFSRVVAAVCEKRGYTYTTKAHDTWSGLVSFNDEYRPIIGFDIGVNSSATKASCDDKTAASYIFETTSVDHVEHNLFRPEAEASLDLDLAPLVSFWESHNCQVVIKPKAGTCGKDIYRIQTIAQLKTTAEAMYKKYGEVCLSPYYAIKHEYRLIMLEGEPEIVFVKDIPTVVGNGTDNFEKLILAQCKNPQAVLKGMPKDRLDEVPGENKRVQLTWKHNLCNGAAAILIDNLETEKMAALVSLAKKTAKVLNTRFASIDIVELDDGRLKVLEVNNGVMTEYLINQFGEPMFERVTNVFDKAFKIHFPDN